MSSLLKKLKLGTENKKTIKFPGTDQDVVIRVLSDKEKQEATVAAHTFLKISDIEYNVLTTGDIFDDELVTQCLWRALYNPDNDMEKLSTTVKEFKSLITLDEKIELTRIYNDFEKECSPDIEKMSEDEFKAIVEDIKKNPQESLGRYSDTNLLKKVITILVNQLST